MLNIIKKIVSVFLVFTLVFSVYGATTSDEDSSAFITKAELNTLKKSYQSKITNMYTNVDPNIDNYTINYLTTNVRSTRLVCPYPIGAVYIQVTDVNPEATLGGSWEKFGEGRTLVGYNDSDTDFNEVLKTGGEKGHKMIEAELPSHTHAYNLVWSGATTYDDGEHYHHVFFETQFSNENTFYGGLHQEYGGDKATTGHSAEAAHVHYYTPKGRAYSNFNHGAGNELPIPLLQPYIVVTFWRRVG